MLRSLMKYLGLGWVKWALGSAVVLAIGATIYNWDSDRFDEFKTDLVNQWNGEADEIEESEIAKDDEILKTNAGKSVNDVATSLQSDCRDCDGKQEVRVLRTEGDYSVTARQIDGTNSASDRYTKPDSKKAMPDCVISYSINPITNEIEKGCY